MPSYLLLFGSPKEIPWEMQYILSTRGPVGRLDFFDANLGKHDEVALGNYVSALLTNWSATSVQPEHAVVWAVDHPGDITNTMFEPSRRRSTRRSPPTPTSPATPCCSRADRPRQRVCATRSKRIGRA